MMKKIFLFSIFLLLVGCSTNPPSSFNEEQNATNDNEQTQSRLLGDMPLPPGSLIKKDSLILGSGAAWTGRLSIGSSSTSMQSYVFFRDEFPKQSWTLVSSVTSKKSVLVFLKNDRSVTIEIEDASFGFKGEKAAILLTVAPKPSK
jgi:hypothetical protein